MFVIRSPWDARRMYAHTRSVFPCYVRQSRQKANKESAPLISKGHQYSVIAANFN